MTEAVSQEVFTLSNGIRVVLEPMPFVKTAAFGIYVGVGSVCETKENNGISHMIEHMLFKGTKTRNAAMLADLTARLGDTVNAYTGKEYTAYYGLTIAEELKTMMEILADMLHNSIFEKDALAKEKSVITEEIDMYNDAPDDYVHEFAQKRVWEGHPISFQISGSKGVVRSITRERLLDFYKKMYRPERMVISVSGAFSPKEIKGCLEEMYGGGAAARLRAKGQLYDDRYGKRMAQKAPILRNGGIGASSAEYHRAFAKAQKDTAQLHMSLVFPSISYLDARKELSSVFVSVLGGSNNSLLFQKIREDNGLAYTVYAYTCPYAKEGLLYLNAVSSPAQAEEIYKRMNAICEEMKTTEISEETLATHKALIKTEMILSNESVQSRMERNGRQLLTYGRLYSTEETLEGINSVTAKDICTYAKELLDFEKQSICLVGDCTKAEKKLRRLFELG